MNLENKTVVVTGVASGIGEQVAKLLKEEGATVIGLDRNTPSVSLDKYICYDQSSESSIEDAVNAIEDKIDILCNIAGVPPTLSADKVLEINFLGFRYLTEMMLDKMNTGGSVINLASMAGFLWQNNLDRVKALLALGNISDATRFCEEQGIVAGGMDPNSSYPLAKQAVTFWSLSNVQRFVERGLRINVVSPGPVVTPILDDFVASIGEIPKEGFLALLRHGEAEEVARVVRFLCREESGWVNGANIPVDGGLSAWLTTGGLESSQG